MDLWVKRQLSITIENYYKKGRSVFLLGPRQTGKSSLLQKFSFDWSLNFLDPRLRRRYEKTPELFLDEVREKLSSNSTHVPFRIHLDEVQKVPGILDVLQLLLDEKKVQIMMTGSSLRKLHTRREELNLLPGRLITLKLDPLSLPEWPSQSLDSLLKYGSLPGLISFDEDEKEDYLRSYVETYLEEEVRKEALVRRLDHFERFLELAAVDSGKISNLNEIAKQIGVAQTTIATYYEILVDCFIVERINPITKSNSRKKITRSPRYLFFDLGVRRLAANEDPRVTDERKGEWFEQWVALEILRFIRGNRRKEKLSFWRDPDGPEVDWVICGQDRWTPVEVKWSEKPTLKMAKHLEVFMSEYPLAKHAYLVCRTPHSFKLSERVTAIPWKEFLKVFEEHQP